MGNEIRDKIDIQGFALQRSFERACKRNDLVKLQSILAAGYDIHENDDWVFRQACGKSSINIIEYLLKNGANVHANKGEPFRAAAMYNKIKTMKLLVKWGADFNDPVVLRNSVYLNFPKVVEYLIDSKVDIHSYDSECFNTCVEQDNLNMLKLLLKHAEPDKIKFTGLFLKACFFSAKKVINFFILDLKLDCKSILEDKRIDSNIKDYITTILENKTLKDDLEDNKNSSSSKFLSRKIFKL